MHVVSRRVKIMKINCRLFEEGFRKKTISNMEFSCKVYKFSCLVIMSGSTHMHCFSSKGRIGNSSTNI